MNELEILQKVLQQFEYDQKQVQKADVVAPFSTFVVTKAWEDAGVIYREGWISTNDQDREKEVTEPEAFAPVLDDYFARGAPLSNTHDTRGYPVGHLQKGALLRDGRVFKESTHPSDAAEFTALPSAGTGFYARVAINEPTAATQVQKGNLGGCSFIAGVKRAEPLPGGGRRFLEFSHLMETTIAAYPINPKAVLTIAKAYGYQPEEETMTPEQIQEMIKKAIEQTKQDEEVKKAAATAQAQTITQDQLTVILSEQQKQFDAKLDEAKKAFGYDRNGVGRSGTVTTPASEREADPLAYIIKKAESGEELDDVDKELMGGITLAAILDGLRD